MKKQENKVKVKWTWRQWTIVIIAALMTLTSVASFALSTMEQSGW